MSHTSQFLLLAAAVSLAGAHFGGAEEGLRTYIQPIVTLAILMLAAILRFWQVGSATKLAAVDVQAIA